MNNAQICVAELFRTAGRKNVPAVILLHNHPSCDESASLNDLRITKEIIKAGKILDIELIDHIIMSNHGFLSLKRRGLAFGGTNK